VPADPVAEAAPSAPTKRWASGADEDPRLTVQGRMLSARRRAGSVAWFDFAALCAGPRSQNDYLELARRFAVIIVSASAAGPGDRRPGPSLSRGSWTYCTTLRQAAGVRQAPADELYTEGTMRRISRGP